MSRQFTKTASAHYHAGGFGLEAVPSLAEQRALVPKLDSDGADDVSDRTDDGEDN